MVTKLVAWYYHKKALYGLRKKYLFEMSVEEVSKDWIKACIIERKQEFRRNELIEAQKKEDETKLFYKWLKAQK